MSDKKPAAVRRIGNKPSNCKTKEGFDNECSICHELLASEDIKGGYGQLDCKHCFHVDCLFTWYDLGNKTCPMRRRTFVEDSDEILRGGRVTSTKSIKRNSTKSVKRKT